MKNMVFEEMSEVEKREKLRAVLREKTGGLLRTEELDGIIRQTPLQEQHSILVYRDWTVMSSDMTGCQSDVIRLLIGGECAPNASLEKLLAVMANEDSAITVIAKSANSTGRSIFIYIPRCRKGGDYIGCRGEKENAGI